MTIRILPFGTLLHDMMFIRNISITALAKKAYMPEEAVSMLARGMFQPTPECEHKLRVLLDWPKGTDDLLSIVAGSKFSDEVSVPEAQPDAHSDTRPEWAPESKPEPVAIAPRLNHEQAQVLRKKLGRPRKVRSEEPEDLDGDAIERGELRGTVVA
jgi:hypothetical protein